MNDGEFAFAIPRLGLCHESWRRQGNFCQGHVSLDLQTIEIGDSVAEMLLDELDD